LAARKIVWISLQNGEEIFLIRLGYYTGAY